jgi:hypothetical protein
MALRDFMFSKKPALLLHQYSHKSIYQSTTKYNKKEMSPKSTSLNISQKHLKIERERENILSIVPKETNKKETDEPLFLLRYDD